MRMSPRLAVSLAVAAAAVLPSAARAEIIDYDPAVDQVPQILTDEEIAKYNQLRSITRPSVSTTISPDGRYVLVTNPALGQGTRRLDTVTKEFSPWQTPDGFTVASTYTWLSDTEAIAFLCRIERNPQGQIVRMYDFNRANVDFGTGTFTLTPIDPPAMPDRRLTMALGRALLQTSDGTYHAVGYTVPAGFQDAVVEVAPPPTFDARTPEERAAIGDAVEAPQQILQTPAELVAVSLADGSLKTIGTVPAGVNIASVASGLAAQPRGNTFAYVTTTAIPWTGIVVGGRANRGGGMPTSYYNVQENLGRIPESLNRHITGTSLTLVNFETGQQTVIKNVDHTPGKFAAPMWTADGRWLVVRCSRPSVLEGRAHPIYEYSAGIDLKVFAPDGSVPPDGAVAVPSLRDLNPPMDSGSLTPLAGTKFLATVPVNTTRHLYVVDVADASVAPVSVYSGDDMMYSFAYAPAADKLVAVFGNAADPGEIYTATAGAVEATREKLTESNPVLDTVSTIATRTFSYKTSAGYDLKGVYVYPRDWSFPPPEPKPLVVWQEGGPGGQMLNTWGSSVESPYSLLPNFGIPVLIVNGSGRTSNGGRFYNDMADGRNFGQRDIQDVKEAVDYLIEMDVVDPKAVGVTGCSYGGYFTLQSLTTYPDFYAAGNSQCSLNDVLYEYNFGWSPFLGYLVGRSTTDDPAEYIKDAPTYNAYKIKAPLLQFHGTSDFLPFEHITNIHDQVNANGVETVFFRALGFGHGLGNAVNAEGQTVPNSGVNAQRYAFQLQLKWFRDHLGHKPMAQAWLVRSVRPLLPRAPFQWEVK